MKKTILSCLTAFVLLCGAVMPCAARVQEGQNTPANEKQNTPVNDALIARLKEARAKDRSVTIKFKNGAKVSGKVGELREKGFTFWPDGKDNQMRLKQQNAVAAVLYEDIVAVKNPSKVKKFFSNVGLGFMMAGVAIIILPVYAVAAALGRVPEC